MFVRVIRMEEMTRSRRERPAKPALSREWIVAETIAIMKREGLEKATMRRVAKALDTGPASLYVYVANTAELHAAVLDELLGALDLGAVPASTGDAGTVADWQGRLEALLRGYAAVLFAYPGLARSALVLRASGPNSVLLYDRALGLLLEGGVEPWRASWGVDLLLQYVTANAAEHSDPAPGDIQAVDDEEARWDDLTRALRTADPLVAPHLARHADAMLGGAPEQRVTWALRALVAGLVITPTPFGSD
jgi:AcrR family transcriptional regulator